MTLLIGTVCGSGINPVGYEFQFEPGIVIAGDTRLTSNDGSFRDDGLKIESVGANGICGMASDNIAVPTAAFHHFDKFLTDNPQATTSESLKALRRNLKQANSAVSKSIGKPITSSALYGYHDPVTDKYLLFSLHSNDGFKPTAKAGWVALGSHSSWMKESFDTITTSYGTLNEKPFDVFPPQQIPVVNGVGEFSARLVKAALQVATEAESVTGSPQAIGGKPQLVALTNDGVTVKDPSWFNKLVTWQIDNSGLQ